MIYVTGDTHGNFMRLFDFCQNTEVSADDYMIILGDAGINYYKRELSNLIKDDLSSLPLKLFCIHGNHEKRPSTDKDDTDITMGGYEVIELINGDIQGRVMVEPNYPKIYFAIDGEIYLMRTANNEWMNVLVCGGAYSVDKPYRLYHGWNWFANEQPDEKTKAKVMAAAQCNRIDIMMTHTCPTRAIPTELFIPGIDQSQVDRTTEEFLEQIYNVVMPDLKCWYFGHYHGEKDSQPFIMLYNRIVNLIGAQW